MKDKQILGSCKRTEPHTKKKKKKKKKKKETMERESEWHQL